MDSFWDVFIQRTIENPQAIALVDGDRRFSYAEVAAKASAVGCLLRVRGVGEESLVALQMEKSTEYIIAMLGVWHAGAAFVPLPPSLPQARRDYIVQQAGIRHFLNAKDVQGVTPAQKNVSHASVSEKTLAYVMYTSGSTGQPKGVMVEHRGIVNFIAAQREAFQVTDKSRCLFCLSINFDASISDIGVAFLSGAVLVIVPDNIVRDGGKFMQILHAQKITHMDIPPSLLKILSVDDMPTSLETVIIGGEACPISVVRKWASKIRLVNVYGPTEATVCTSLCLCDAQTWEKPLIGDPLPGVSYHVLDEDMNDADAGELYIGGLQLARGYLGNPGLTEDKFIHRQGIRLYKTGDKVRRHEKSIEFVGRIDRQFKLRGQLVEPDEIETCLMNFPGVERAAVINKSESLVAFIQSKHDLPPSDIVGFLSLKLPSWMIPQHFHILAQMPLTATGKPDFSALRAASLFAVPSYRAVPATETEEKLFDVWKNVLRHENFGVTDDFFKVGGDSLSVIRLTLESERHGVSVSNGMIAQYPTIRLLAAAIEGDLEKADVLSAERLKGQVAFNAEWQDVFDLAQNRPENRELSNIFLTGAAGFLGSRVLHELLLQTSASIYCLIRAPDTVAALERIKSTLGKYALHLSPEMEARIVPLCGDLVQKDFGLKNWINLSQKIDAVYHCAAVVNMTASCADLWPANVTATQEVLRFCCAGKRKQLHYASTLSVFVSTDQNKGRLYENDRLERTRQVYGGYAQTKWAAEYMLLQVLGEACGITHYRFGLITGDQKNGIGACRDFLAMFAKGIASIGAAPEGFDDILHVDITPVDYAAAAMVKLSRAEGHDVYHVANSESLSLGGIISALKRQGKHVSSMPLVQWRAAVAQMFLTTEETAAVLGLCRCLPQEGFNSRRTMDLFQATDVIFDASERRRVLMDECPAPSGDLIDLYMKDIFKEELSPLKICIFGPESTGKSSLAERMARHYGATFVPEFAKGLIFANEGKVTYEDMPRIARGQRQAEKEAEAEESNILFCDTDILTTMIWSEWLFDKCPDWIRAAADIPQYDLYLLMDVDTPWVQDMHRFLPDDRKNFFERCKSELEKRKLPYMILSGAWDQKFTTACAAIDDMMKEKKDAA